MIPRLPTMRVLSVAAMLVSSALTASTVENLSFGQSGVISANGQFIPHWRMSGEGHRPHILSDRVILTPPAPGNKRGALWNEMPNENLEWTANFEFRASGIERGSGNLQIWYTRLQHEALASIYTVGEFDGLAIVVDQYGGEGGTIRGFLNDGSTHYQGLTSVDAMAFGHCTYAYRNMGRMSRLKIEQAAGHFSVTIDDRVCFQTDKVKLPPGYFFGISAASGENPDSFEVGKFVVSTLGDTNSEAPVQPDMPQQQNQQAPPTQAVPLSSATGGNANVETQLSQLMERLQQLTGEVQNALVNLDSSLGKRHEELSAKVGKGIPHAQIDSIERRLGTIESTVQRIQNDVEGRDYRDHLQRLQESLKETQTNLLASLPQSMSQIVSTSAPKMGLFIFIIIAFQVALAGLYVVYKKRRANSPKKLL